MRKSLQGRVEAIEIDGFRGIPGSLVVSFGLPGQPTSALIFGENGAGKSTVVDAIEWACQGRVGRQSPSGNPGSPSVINVNSGSGVAHVRAQLFDGLYVEREARMNGDGVCKVTGDPSPAGYQRVPMSLKRADILRFLGTPALERGKVFMGHSLGDKDAGRKMGPDENEIARNELHAAKESMRAAGATLAEKVGQKAPRSAAAIEQLLAEHVYNGIPKEIRGMVKIKKSYEEDVSNIEQCRAEVVRLKEQVRRTERIAPDAVARLRAMNEVLGDVSAWITHAFLTVTQAKHVARLEVAFGAASDMSLEIVAEMGNGARRTPQQVFSEGFQDLIALLYFLAVLHAAGERGQSRVLILDDVLQSVDAGIRVSLMDFVVQEFADWQLLITVHDRMWRTQLRDVFQRAGHAVTEIEVRGWNFEHGPTVGAAANSDPAAALWAALSAEDPQTVCGVAGRVLERACDRMSWTIPITVKRKRGDSYTLGDLWPGTAKELKGTNLAKTVVEVDRWIHLRNAAGAHFNEWAEGVTWTEAERFGWSVAELLAGLHCSHCCQWVGRSAPRHYVCGCGATQVAPVT